MNRKILLLALGFLVALAMSLNAPTQAETRTKAFAGDAVATAQTSPIPAVVKEVPAAEIVTVVAAGTIYKKVSVVKYRPVARVYVLKTPMVIVPVKVRRYKKLYSTPIRNALFGTHRTAVVPVSLE